MIRRSEPVPCLVDRHDTSRQAHTTANTTAPR
jgi:hypothetical protein